jgi:hypothetical protein
LVSLRSFTPLIPSGKTVHLALVLGAGIATCWLFLAYEQGELLKDALFSMMGVAAGGGRVLGYQRMQRLPPPD